MIFEPSLALCLVSPSAVMIRRALFDSVGLFDENLPACEDYDLWLRVSRQYPIHLIEKPLIVKRGGHDDQLSASPGLDKYRIASIIKLLENNVLSEKQCHAARKILLKKCHVYAGGCQKRGKHKEYLYYSKIAKKFAF